MQTFGLVSRDFVTYPWWRTREKTQFTNDERHRRLILCHYLLHALAGSLLGLVGVSVAEVLEGLDSIKRHTFWNSD